MCINLILLHYFNCIESDNFHFSYGSISINEEFANISWERPQQCSFTDNYALRRALRGEVQNETIYSSISTNSIQISTDMFQTNDSYRFKYYIEAFCNNTSYFTDTSVQFFRDGKSFTLHYS